MLKGTPYWGNSTFSDLTGLVSRKPVEIDKNKLSDICNKKGVNICVKDLYTAFLAIVELNLIILVDKDKGFCSWGRDVRFNYRDKYIFLPYYSFDREEIERKAKVKDTKYLDMVNEKTVSIKYNFKLETLVIDNRESNYRLDSLLLYDLDTRDFYNLVISDLSYLEQDFFDVEDLYSRYINSSFIVTDLVSTNRKWSYNTISSSKQEFKTNESKMRSYYKLGRYIEGVKPKELKYMDVRAYPFEEIMGDFIVDDEIAFDLRRYYFEAYLYCIFADKIACSDTRFNKELNALRKNKRYIRYGRKYPLILKYYYYSAGDLFESGKKIRKKTYERFRK